MTLSSKLCWAVLLGMALLIIGMMVATGAPALQSPKGSEAAASLARSSVLPPMPAIVIPPETNFTDYYFAATATDKSGLSSDYSNEAILRAFESNAMQSVTLAWDASPGTNVITNYSVYQGAASANYTNIVNAGTNLTVTMRLAPLAPTNLLVTVRCALTNLPPLVLTNPPTSYYQAGASNMGGSKYLLRYQTKPALKSPWTWIAQPSGTNSSKPSAGNLRVTIATNRF
jgi:hypothetical protein